MVDKGGTPQPRPRSPVARGAALLVATGGLVTLAESSKSRIDIKPIEIVMFVRSAKAQAAT
jgi:hypothetical protein